MFFSGILVIFSIIQWMLATWPLAPLTILNRAWTSGISQFMYCGSLAWRILNIILLACEMSAVVNILWHCLSLKLGWKLTFSNHVATAEFSRFSGILSAPLPAASFRIWNSSTGILSPPLTLFIVMLPKAQLTLHSRMSGSRWVLTPSWLSGSWRYFWIVLLCILATSS